MGSALLHRIRWQAWLPLALVCSVSLAQDDQHIVYKLQPRDTLLSLVSQYMQGPDALQQIVQYNNLRNPNLVPVGYQLKIPRQLIRYIPSEATVHRLNCRNISRIENDNSVPLQTGDKLLEGHIVRIPAGCQLAVVLEDQSVMRMMSGAMIRFKVLRRNMLEHSPEVRVELMDGRMEVDVPRKRQAGDAPFEVRTPNSVAGVRGTEFRVAFDARQRNSQVEVVTGVVSAAGQADRQAQRAQAGQGVPIQPNGQALPVENFLDAPRYKAATKAASGDAWELQFSAPEQARQLLIRESEDASFVFFQPDRKLDRPHYALADPGSTAKFQQWSAVSATGIVGHSAYYGFCKGYKRKDVLRCNIHFNMTGLEKPRMRLQKTESSGQTTLILDQEVQIGANDQLVFRGLPSGRYSWQIEYALGPERRASQRGEFELVAIPAEP